MNQLASSSIEYNRISSCYTRNVDEGIFDGEDFVNPTSIQVPRALVPLNAPGERLNALNSLNCITTPLLTSVFLNHSSELKNPLTGIYQKCESNSKRTANVDIHPETKRKRRKISEDNSIQSSYLQLNPASSNDVMSSSSPPKKGIQVITSKFPSIRCEHPSKQSTSSISPFSFVQNLLSTRSYPTQRNRKMITYFSVPSPLQKASFGTAVLNCVKSGDTNKLERLVKQGLSPNPCNAFGDSLLDLICKRGDDEMFKILLSCGATIHVVDSFGRTPLHHLCWCKDSPFKLVEKILDIDPTMILAKDLQGLTPLEYVSCEKWPDWVEFFLANGDKFWPKESSFRQEETDLIKRTDSISDPPCSLSIEDAVRVSAGKAI